MKKLIALSLAAASSFLFASNAMALQQGNRIVTIDGAAPRQAVAYLVANIDNIGGACVYGLDVAGPLNQSPTTTCFIQERKALGASDCFANATRDFPTSVSISTLAPINTCTLPDQFGFRANALTLVGSDREWSVVLSTIPFLPLAATNLPA